MLREKTLLFSEMKEEKKVEVVRSMKERAQDIFLPEKSIKVYSRLDSSGVLSYARSKKHLGTQVVTSEQVSADFKNESIREVFLSALRDVETELINAWPFLPGSHSWIELRIHPESRSVQVTRAVRLSATDKNSIQYNLMASKMLLRAFSGLEIKLSEWTLHHSQEKIKLSLSDADITDLSQRSATALNDAVIRESGFEEFYVCLEFGKIRFKKFLEDPAKATKASLDLHTPIVIL